VDILYARNFSSKSIVNVPTRLFHEFTHFATPLHQLEPATQANASITTRLPEKNSIYKQGPVQSIREFMKFPG
jgi:hypothetical protein